VTSRPLITHVSGADLTVRKTNSAVQRPVHPSVDTRPLLPVAYWRGYVVTAWYISVLLLRRCERDLGRRDVRLPAPGVPRTA
jgi:hypothetical protein